MLSSRNLRTTDKCGVVAESRNTIKGWFISTLTRPVKEWVIIRLKNLSTSFSFGRKKRVSKKEPEWIFRCLHLFSQYYSTRTCFIPSSICSSNRTIKILVQWHAVCQVFIFTYSAKCFFWKMQPSAETGDIYSWSRKYFFGVKELGRIKTTEYSFHGRRELCEHCRCLSPSVGDRFHSNGVAKQKPTVHCLSNRGVKVVCFFYLDRVDLDERKTERHYSLPSSSSSDLYSMY